MSEQQTQPVQQAYGPQSGGYPPPPDYGYPQYNPYYQQPIPPGYGYPQQPAPTSSQSLPAENHPANLDLVMNVPVQVTVELGRTKHKIHEILQFGSGSVVELDKQAASPVDIIVNGILVAHGDLVVVDDNFSVRVTKIIKAHNLLSSL